MSDVTRALRGGGEIPELARAAAERFAERMAGETDVAYDHMDSPIGRLILANSARGLVRVHWIDGETEDQILEEIAAGVSPRILHAPGRLDQARRELEEYFEGRRTRFDVPVDWTILRGFTRKVLEATARIPFGSVSTYTDVARRAGSPRAQRAAGNALGANPIPIVVPCHRVLHKDGGLGGYGGGLDRKRTLLSIEGAL
jgi:methylated-DNA-[protein]-cysteine S-methyltransferase